jgi:hypothetical protein
VVAASQLLLLLLLLLRAGAHTQDPPLLTPHAHAHSPAPPTHLWRLRPQLAQRREGVCERLGPEATQAASWTVARTCQKGRHGNALHARGLLWCDGTASGSVAAHAARPQCHERERRSRHVLRLKAVDHVRQPRAQERSTQRPASRRCCANIGTANAAAAAADTTATSHQRLRHARSCPRAVGGAACVEAVRKARHLCARASTRVG